MSGRILFVHQNFPGQFIHLAPELAKLGHDVVGLTAEGNQRPQQIRTFRYRHEAGRIPGEDWKIAAHFAEQSRRGERVALAAFQLKRSGYDPDLVIGHPGWGETMFLPDVWPRARCVNYAEFFYRPTGLDVGFDPEFYTPDPEHAIRVRSRQASQLLALQGSHLALSPTAWQASTYPPELQHKIRVLHDGIDTERVQPVRNTSLDLPDGRLRITQGKEILTFVSRNLEPYRGFHVFMC